MVAAMEPRIQYAQSPSDGTMSDQPKEPLQRLRVRLALIRGRIAAVLIAAVAATLAACGGGTAADIPPLDLPDIDIELDETLMSQLADAVDALPEPIGDNDRDQIRSMIGLPDAFTISFERSGEEGDGPLVRYETWSYYELVSAYEFADGALISNLPMELVEGLVVLPKRYDPAVFKRSTTWDDIVPMLTEPDSFAARKLEPEFELPIVYYAGEQLLVAFDDEGLAYVETSPVGAEQP